MSVLLFDLSDWSQIELTGKDRQPFLNGFCTNDVKKLASGEGCEAFLSNIKGRVIGHIQVFADDRRLCLESEPGQAAAVIEHLDRYLISEDVQLVDRTNDWGLLLIVGDDAPAVLESCGLCPSERVPQHFGAHVVLQGIDSSASLRRGDFTSQPNWTISADRETIGGLQSQLVAAGAVVSDRTTFESQRIEHGYPLFGIDLSEDNLIHESARVRQAVSFTKGCYLGQEPIARLDSLGHVNRHLCRLRIATSTTVAAGARVLQSKDGEQSEVGHVTSAAPMSSDIAGDEAVAIALVKRDAALAGTELLVELADSSTAAATVAAAT